MGCKATNGTFFVLQESHPVINALTLSPWTTQKFNVLALLPLTDSSVSCRGHYIYSIFVFA